MVQGINDVYNSQSIIAQLMQGLSSSFRAVLDAINKKDKEIAQIDRADEKRKHEDLNLARNMIARAQELVTSNPGEALTKLAALRQSPEGHRVANLIPDLSGGLQRIQDLVARRVNNSGDQGGSMMTQIAKMFNQDNNGENVDFRA